MNTYLYKKYIHEFIYVHGTRKKKKYNNKKYKKETLMLIRALKKRKTGFDL